MGVVIGSSLGGFVALTTANNNAPNCFDRGENHDFVLTSKFINKEARENGWVAKE